MLEKLKKLLFPPRCVFCRSLLGEGEEYLCRWCGAKVRELSRPKAYKGAFYDRALSVYAYEGSVRRAVHRYKFHGGVHLADFFGMKMAERVKNEGWSFDIITAAPSHLSKRFKKGYDHAYLLAESVAGHAGVRCARLLKKTRRTGHMYGLTPAQRRANIMGSIAVSCSVEEIKNRRILLVDDILTTGSTASECARVLREAGAACVAVITAAGIK